MKKVIVPALALMVIASTPAQAISRGYRAQLARQAHGSTFAVENILGLSSVEASAQLRKAGFREVSKDRWEDQHGRSIAIIWSNDKAASVTVRTVPPPAEAHDTRRHKQTLTE